MGSNFTWLFFSRFILILIVFTTTRILPTTAAHYQKNNTAEAPGPISCRVVYSDMEKKLKIVEDCGKKHNFDPKINGTFEEHQELMRNLSANGFDDKCFTKCWYEKTGIIEKDGRIQVRKFNDLYETSNITAGLRSQLMTWSEECVKFSEGMVKDSKEIPCRMYAITEFCLFEKAIKNKSKLEELCHMKN